jgi:hypothetical protein
MGSCGPDKSKSVVTEEVIEELENREIIKISRSRIQTSGFDLGATVENDFLNKLQTEDFSSCDSLIRTIEKSYSVAIDLYRLNEEAEDTLINNSFLEPYRYSIQNQLPAGANLTDLSENLVIYSNVLKPDSAGNPCFSTNEWRVLIIEIPVKQIITSIENKNDEG